MPSTNADDKNSTSADDHLSSVQNAISGMLQNHQEGGDMATENATLHALLIKLSFYICSVNDKLTGMQSGFQTLASQISAMSDSSQTDFRQLKESIQAISNKIGLDLLPEVSRATAPGDGPKSIDNDSVSETATATSAQPPQTFVFILSHEIDVLNATFPFKLRIGALTFNSFEQAHQYIKCIMQSCPNRAAEIKVAQTPIQAAMIGNRSGLTLSMTSIKDMIQALFYLKAEQCEGFSRKLEQHGPDVRYALVLSNRFWGTGMREAQSRKVAPKFIGANFFGNQVTAFAEEYLAHSADENAAKIAEAKRYLGEFCRPDLANLVDVDRKVLLLGDLQIEDFEAEFDTEMVQYKSLQAVEKVKNFQHTAVQELQKLKLTDYGAIVMVFGTYEVGRPPESIERNYIQLLEYLTREIQHKCGIWVANAMPRNDRFASKVVATNYAIQIAVRNFEKKDDAAAPEEGSVCSVQLLNLYEKFAAWAADNPASAGEGTYAALFRENGYQLNSVGTALLGEILAELVPVANLKLKNLPPDGRTMAPGPTKTDGSPPMKRARIRAANWNLNRGIGSDTRKRGVDRFDHAGPSRYDDPYYRRSLSPLDFDLVDPRMSTVLDEYEFGSRRGYDSAGLNEARDSGYRRGGRYEDSTYDY